MSGMDAMSSTSSSARRMRRMGDQSMRSVEKDLRKLWASDSQRPRSRWAPCGARAARAGGEERRGEERGERGDRGGDAPLLIFKE